MNFRVSVFFHEVQKHDVGEESTINHNFTACSLGNITAKNYENWLIC